MLVRNVAIEKRSTYGLTLIVIGVLCITIGNVLERFLNQGISDFFSGMLSGLSVVFNITGMYFSFHSPRANIKSELATV